MGLEEPVDREEFKALMESHEHLMNVVENLLNQVTLLTKAEIKRSEDLTKLHLN